MIAIVDYGLGNLGSLLNMFKRIGVPACIESDPSALSNADKIVLPGVGAFDTAMRQINELPKLRPVLEECVLIKKVPLLGVCLGMQLLTQGSEEGELPGLGWIPGFVRRFPRQVGLKVPHMGWNIARPVAASNLTINVGLEPRYYFVHSYYVQVDDPSHSLMRSHYGNEFDSAIGRDNIYGVQYHPEKSHRFGMQIFKNFAEL